MKTCFKCCRNLPESEFYAHSRMGDELLGKCKECTRLDVRENRRRRLGYYRQYDRERFKEPSRKASVLEAQDRRRANYPEKYKARTAVGNAIRDGRLVRQPCEVCGDPKSQAHHEDYSKPLEVRWLCFVHHRIAHGQYKELA